MKHGRPYHLLLRLFALLLIWGASWTAHAQEKASRPTPPDDARTLEPVVVTATRIEVPATTVTDSVTVITGREIEAQGARDVLEVLRDVPGVAVVQTGSRGGTTSLFLRGGESDFTLVLIDGVKVNDAGGFFDFSRLTTDNIEKIEIVRGPQSALYGSDAIAGVIQIFTKRGSGRPKLTTSFDAGSFRTFEERASISGGSERTEYSFLYGRIDSDGLLDLNNDYRNQTFSSLLTFRPTSDLRLSLSARYTDAVFHFPTDFVPGSVRGAGFPPVDPRQKQENGDLALGLTAHYRLFPWWEHRIQLSLSNKNSLFRDDPDPTPSDTGLRQIQTDERRKLADYLQSVTVQHGRRSASTLSLGVELSQEEIDKTSVFIASGTGTTSSTQADQSRRNLAVYAQALWGWNDRLFATAGARLDDNEFFGTEVNPKFSASYLLQETGTRVRVAYGTGIRAPSFLELFGTPTFPGNPDLKPEEARSWEAGLDQTIPGNLLTLHATHFRNRFTDLIASSCVFGAGGAPQSCFQNIQAAKTWGVEASMEIRPATGLSIVAAYTFLDTGVTDAGGVSSTAFEVGQPLLRRPRHSGSFAIFYDRRPIRLALNGTIVGKRTDRDFSTVPERRVTNPGYEKLDAGVSYLLWKSIYLKGTVQNILDERYEEAVGFEAPRINFLVGIEAAF